MPASEGSIGRVERILFLKKLPAFESLAAEQLAVVAEHTRERLFPKGSVLLQEGEPVGAVYLVVDGKVRIGRRGRLLGHAGAGAGVGGGPLFARDSEGIEAVCETDTLALELDADALLEIFEDHFPILQHVLRETCRDLIRLVRRVPAGLLDASVARQGPLDIPPRDLDLVQRILLLRTASPFTRSSINALAELSRGGAEVAFDPGVTLWEEGHASGAMFIVVSGLVACSAQGGEMRFLARSGDPLGAVESVAELPRWYRAVTETKVVALEQGVEGLIDVFEDNFEMALDYLAAISRLYLDLKERTASGREEELLGDSA